MIHPDITVIDFEKGLEEPIKRLNYEWLERYFRLEDSDIKSLADPKAEIIDKGGFIFYAKYQDEIVGTASLLKKANNIFELGKMAVTEKAQGFGIGKLLIEHCLKFARDYKIEKLILYSNTQLGSAIHLYRKYGFEEVDLESGLYERANIKMELRIE
ncbi:MAG TPA: GNAT family N-acetyltransferase [Saprospiraceae bacterium]|nr:GNAT family N-acetyltransferase [Saprospiraceae bacterium]